MPLTQRSRSALYHGLTEVIDDDQAVEEMLSYFPSRDVEEPVTKEFLRAEMADLRAEMADLRSEMADLRAEMHAGFRRMTIQMYGSMVAFAGVVVAAGALTG